MLLKDKIAVITGAASGIGQASAVVFAREGAKIFCTDMDDGGGRETVRLVEREKGEAVCFQADVANSGEVQAMARACEKRFGIVNVLFNNAGVGIKQSFEQTTEETWARMVGVHLTGEFLCAKYLLPLMKKAGSGSIINHASVDAVLGNAALAAYSAAKGGLLPLTHVMAHDLGKYNIRVNSLSTGGISTSKNTRTAGYNSRISVTPLQRTGTAEEVAHVALFLASEWSSYVNGANLVVDGGRTAITQGTYHGFEPSSG